MNRRSFLTKTGLILGGLGVADSFQFDLIEKLGRELLPMANADTIRPRRTLEICFRLGVPLIHFGAGSEFASLTNVRTPNFSYVGNQIQRPAGTSNLLLHTDSAALAPHAANIALTQGVATFDGQHTDLFDYRRGGVAAGSAKITPIVELADLNTTGSMIHGVMFPGTDSDPNLRVRNATGGKRDLEKVNTVADFQGLFKQPTLRFSKQEVADVLGAATRLSSRQAAALEQKLAQASQSAENQKKAQELFRTNFVELLNVTNHPVNMVNITDTPKQARLAKARGAISVVLNAFKNNLINSAVVVVELEDWHGYQNIGQSGPYVNDMSRILAETIKFLKDTDEQGMPGTKLWDTTTIVAGSEFTRAIDDLNVDNADGTTQGFMMIGKNVKGNYYGQVDLSVTRNAPSWGINPNTGAPTPGQKNTSEQAYQTIRQAIGLNLTTTEKERVLKPMLVG